MSFTDFLATSTVMEVAVTTFVFVAFVAAVVAFFSMAVNISRLRQDVQTLQDIAITQHQWLEAERNARRTQNQPPKPGPTS